MNDKEKKAIETLKEIQESNRSWLKETNEQSCEKIYLRDIEAIETVLKLIEKQQYIIEGKECVIETQTHNEEVYEEMVKYKDRIIDLMLDEMAYNYDINSELDIITIKKQLRERFSNKARGIIK